MADSFDLPVNSCCYRGQKFMLNLDANVNLVLQLVSTHSLLFYGYLLTINSLLFCVDHLVALSFFLIFLLFVFLTFPDT